jgi:single-strand DNA-binding protein
MNGNGGNLTQYLKRGAKVFVRGNLSVKQYQDKNGQWCVGLNMSATEIQLCGLKSENTAPTGYNDPFGGQPGGYNPPC